MPPLAQALKKPANIGDMITMPPTPPPAVLPPADQSALGIGATGPSPAIITTPYDSFRQWVRPGVSQTRFPVFPVKANPQAHTTAASGTKQIVNSKGFTSLDKVADGNARLSLHVSHSAPRGGSVGTHASPVTGGSVAYNFRGVWQGTTQYFKGDEVVYQVSYWMAQKTSLNSTPATGNSNWQVIGSYAAFRGPWSSSVNYVAGDEVTYLGNFWVATTANTNSAPSTSNANWQIAGPNNLDSVQDGTDFGRPPVSQYGPNSPIGKLTGFYLSSNPDFERNLTNYNIYDNNGSGSITTSLIAISAAPSGIAPNGTNQVMKIVETHVGVGPTPGLGGFSYGPGGGGISVDTTNVLAADTFHIGDTYIIDLLAWIPTGYTLNWASNSLGTGGSFQWLNGALANTYGPSQPGASAWRHYIGRVIVGTSPSANAFPYFYLTGADGVTWYVGSLHIVDINQTHRHGGIHTLVGSDGTKFGHGVGLSGVGVGHMVHAGNIRTFLNGTPQWGFYGSPGAPVDVVSGGGGAIRAFGAAPGVRMFDTNTGGGQYDFYSGVAAANVQSIRDSGAGVVRTYLNSTPQWGFFGSPSFVTHTFGSTPRVTAASGDPRYLIESTGVGGQVYGLGSFTGGNSFITQEGAAVRTNLTSTPQWGFFGSPGREVDLVQGSGAFRSVGNGIPSFQADDTQTSGRWYGYEASRSAVGVANITDETAGAERVQMNSTPQWGFFAAPGSEGDVQISGTRARIFGGGPGWESADTNASGTNSYFLSGESAAGTTTIFANGGDRTFLKSGPLWGFFGSPGFDLHTFGQVTMNQNGAGLAQYVGRDTRTGGVDFNFQSGGSSAGVGNLGHNGNTRVYLNGTPNLSVFGSNGGDPIDFFAQYAKMQGAVSGWDSFDTQTSGQELFVNSGQVVAGTATLRHAGTHWVRLDGSGNIDLSNATPTSGFITAGAGKVTDTSGNLQLKNKNDAAGSTSNPSTNGTGYTTMAEMTLTFTTKGNKVILIFTGALGLSSSVDTVPGGFVAFFKDGSQLSPDYLIQSTQTANGSIAFIFCGSLSFIDSPTAASHTYDVRWKTNSSNDNLKAINTGRRFQAVELG